MSPTTHKPETQFIAEPGSHATTTIAVLDAPVDKVFRAYTEAEPLSRWWGPRELTTRIETLDARPGGSWRVIHTDPDGNEYAFRGVYHDVVPNERIVQTFEFEGMPGHVCLETATLEDVDGKTKVTAHSVYQSVEDRDGMNQSGAEEFAPVGMAQLEEVASSL
jgi:uncharacterized protein YndB with AHSA1/START domain